jgi:hypothetical protein
VNELVKQAIEKIYRHADHVFYLEKCQKDLQFSEIENLNSIDNNLNISERNIQKVWPSKEWFFDFGEFIEDNFNASFNTVLKVSKVVPVFYIQHEFSVANRISKRIEPTLDGYSGMPYIMAQYDFHEKVSEILTKNNYVELKSSEIHEVLPNLNFPEGVTIFGPQVTVEYALFHDLLDLCPDDDVK